MNAYFRTCIIKSLNYKVAITTRPYRIAGKSRSYYIFGGSGKRSNKIISMLNVNKATFPVL